MIPAETIKFRIKCHKTDCRFEMSENEGLPYSFPGFHVKHGAGTKSVFQMDQLAFVSDIKPLPANATFLNFRSTCMKLTWLSHTRLNVLFEESRLAKVTESIFDANPKKETKGLNQALKYVHENPVAIFFKV